MQVVQKKRQSSEVTRKALLLKVAGIRAEAEGLGAEPPLFEELEQIAAAIQSARALVKKPQNFLSDERKRLGKVKEGLSLLKKNKGEVFLNDTKVSVFLLCSSLCSCWTPYSPLSPFANPSSMRGKNRDDCFSHLSSAAWECLPVLNHQRATQQDYLLHFVLFWDLAQHFVFSSRESL